MSPLKRSTWWLLPAGGLLALLLCAQVVQAQLPGEKSPAQRAEEILAAAGTSGGLVVHVDCNDGRLTAALCRGEGFLVQGLDTEGTEVEQARQHILSAGLAGRVSADRFDGRHLPYIDNSVNLLVAEQLGDLPEQEALRVLAPGGVLCVQRDGRWSKTIKPRPAEMDEWTHYLHDPSNNAVSRDTLVGPPRHFQWLAEPRYSRHHDHMSAASAMVAAGGRLFYIFDHGSSMSIQLPSRWLLVARDAFSGVVLWKKPIATWHTQMFRLKSGPVQVTRRLVAAGERVYVTLGWEAPVSALDAASGELVREYPQTNSAEEFIFSAGILFVVANDQPFRQPADPVQLSYDFHEAPRRIVAVEAASGKVLWNQAQRNVLPCTLGADAGRVVFAEDDCVVCLDRRSGAQLWKSPPLSRRQVIPTFFAPTVVLYNDVVLYSAGSQQADERNAGGGTNTMYALDARSGKLLWSAEHPPSGYKSPEDLLVVQGLVWTPATTANSDSGVMIGRDPRTGEVRKQFLPDVNTHWFHHRCHRGKATERYLLMSRTGIEFVDPAAEHWICNHWVRGACLYGTMPANGLLYNPPHPCACYLEAKLSGFHALAPEAPTRKVPREVPLEGRLERGAAFDQVAASADAGFERDAPAADWPTYRADNQRSGRTPTSVPAALHCVWQAELGGRLTPPVVAEGKLFVAAIDRHTIHALDASSGRALWSFAAGGRIDSPPTIWQGRVLFGSADGYVYCLRADDGALVWRFRAAPLDRRMVACDQVESVWPVSGSVLVREGVLWCVAGRSMFLDGGLRLLRLEAATGKLIGETIMDDRAPGSDENLQVFIAGLNMPVALPDVLVADDKYVYMRSQRFDLEGVRQEIEIPTLPVEAQRGEGAHLFSPTGLLDDVWWHRSYWVYGRVWKSGAGGYYLAGRVAPAGKPLVFDETTIYGYGRKPQYYRWTTTMEYQLFACAKEPQIVPLNAPRRPPARTAADLEPGGATLQLTSLGAAPRQQAGQAQPRPKRPGVTQPAPTRVETQWTQECPVLVRAMVLAGKTLFLAGPPDVVDEEQSLQSFALPSTQEQLARQAAALDGAEGGLLWAVSTADGNRLAEYRLQSVPVFDGLAAADGRLYMVALDGKVLCFADK